MTDSLRPKEAAAFDYSPYVGGKIRGGGILDFPKADKIWVADGRIHISVVYDDLTTRELNYLLSQCSISREQRSLEITTPHCGTWTIYKPGAM